MLCEGNIAQLPVRDLCEGSRAEAARHARGEARDDRYSFELIRRAIAERDGESWQGLIELYQGLVLSWCLRCGANPSEADELAVAAWAKFWQSFTAEKLTNANGSTSAVLGYLKLCAQSVVLDEARRSARLVSLENGRHEIDGGEAGNPESDIERLDAPSLWRLVETHLHDERERRLVYLTYAIDLRPAEIQRRHPDLFPTVQDVYRITRNILDRLRHSKKLAAWAHERTA
jgi:DNA-directed RNA polymerase specialized sigma24 family protein